MRIDFSDIYSAKAPHKNFMVDDILKGFFNYGPKWIESLFSLRHKLVKPFGLKTSDQNTTKINFPLVVGESIGFFKIYEVHENEIILGENDTHLNFKVSIRVKKQTEISIETFVEFNNLFGKIYFQIIKPFHKIIVISMLKSIVKELEVNSK